MAWQDHSSYFAYMCLNPITIKNPNRGLRPKPGTPNSLKDCTSEYIQVPCGHCSECIHTKQMGMVQRCQMEALSHYLFFSTLTYNQKSLPHILTSTGYDIAYADQKHVSGMIKRLRRHNAFGRPFRYLAVSELGSKRGRPHFHILWLIPKYSGDDKFTILNLERKMFKEILKEWRINLGSTRAPIWQPLCSYQRKFIHGHLRTNYDTHYVDSKSSLDSTSSVAFYVLKYMMKPSTRETRLKSALWLNLSPEEYEATWKVVKSRKFYSHDFGQPDDPAVFRHIRRSIELSKDKDFPCFLNPDTGQYFPLARYYKDKGLYTFEDALERYNRDIMSPFADTPQVTDFTRKLQEIYQKQEKHEKDIQTSDDNCRDDLFSYFD